MGNKQISFLPIGRVENQFENPEKPETLQAVESQLIIDQGLVVALNGLTPGQKLMVLFHFHRSQNFELLQHPRGDKDQPKRGVFSLHSPQRPNPIGVTIVELEKINNNILTVRGLDAINGTPILDLKPA